MLQRSENLGLSIPLSLNTGEATTQPPPSFGAYLPKQRRLLFALPPRKPKPPAALPCKGSELGIVPHWSGKGVSLTGSNGLIIGGRFSEAEAALLVAELSQLWMICDIEAAADDAIATVAAGGASNA